MKKVLLFAILLGMAQPLMAGKFPNFRAKDLNNRPVEFEQLKGEKLTVVDFWATWCKPCVRSIPKLVELYDKFKDRGVQFVGINVDGTRNLPKVKPAARSLKIAYPVVLDLNNEIMNNLNITAIPYLLVVDSEGNIVTTHQGYRPGDEKILEQEILELLEKLEGK